jgi:type VI protein secretion system component VasK
MNWINELSVLDSVLIAGIVWLSGVFLWILRKFICSYNQNTTVMTEVGKTLTAMDQKLDTANNVDREILVELARIRNPVHVVKHN